MATDHSIPVDCCGLEDAGPSRLVLLNDPVVGLVGEERSELVPDHVDGHRGRVGAALRCAQISGKSLELERLIDIL